MRKYKASARKQVYKDSILFYPIVKFDFGYIQDEYWLNSGQPTRAKALTISRNYIKHLEE